MNNLMFPLVIGLALGKKKKLTKQESVKAAVMNSLGAQMGGNVGTVLGTMTAVDAEANKNKLEESNKLLNKTRLEHHQTNEDLKILLEQIDKNRNGEQVSFTITPEVQKVLDRRLPQRPNGSANGGIDALYQLSQELDALLKAHGNSKQNIQQTVNRGAATSSGTESSNSTKTAQVKS